MNIFIKLILGRRRPAGAHDSCHPNVSSPELPDEEDDPLSPIERHEPWLDPSAFEPPNHEYVLEVQDDEEAECDDFCVNPANGLPMIGGEYGVDVEGNPFGCDSSIDTHVDELTEDVHGSDSPFTDDLWSAGVSYSSSDDLT